MSSLRTFKCRDFLKMARINLDPLTETYALPFYLQYYVKWPEYFLMSETPSGEVQGYIMGKSETFRREGESSWHGHVTCLTVSPEHRRMGLANRLMHLLEQMSELKSCYFVDLFVRKSNEAAINMYSRLGYSVYREVIDYYSSGEPAPPTPPPPDAAKGGTGKTATGVVAIHAENENAYDMRKALSRDVDRKSVVPLKQPVYPEDVD
ncbi:N-alpha-acetyltransferase 20-like [Symsagittifera roscoffensis]|uniref:N-alpha-acetyltransferase 20-like n=1 Tax=Symsagittifera roscoffensis TaxID=84072 RepID=UPI00307B2E63